MEILLRSPPGSGIVDEASTDGQAAVKVERPIRASGQDEEQDVGDPASACALWCTIAMGALVHGQPPETVWVGSGLLQTDKTIVCGAWRSRSVIDRYYERDE